MPVREVALRVPATCRPAARDREKQELTESIEEYTEGIFRLQEELAVVGTGDIAKYMGVAPASVTTMLKRLVELGLAEHAPYQGVRLTVRGEELSIALLRKHRLLERLLVDFLELPWDDVHDLACKLEHYISEDVADKISKALGNPTTCPHGNPVDARANDGSFRLSDAVAGDVLSVVKITDERAEFLVYVIEIGLLPGSRVNVKSRTPFGDVMNLAYDTGHDPVAIGRDVANSIWVQRVSERPALQLAGSET
jgi:DtxR family Mn-dependent transcriptional regulator